MYHARLTIQGLPKTPNELLRRHWTEVMEQKKRWHYDVWGTVMAHGKPPQPLKFAHVKMTRHSEQEPDSDGLSGSFKYVRDGLVQCGVLIDDSPRYARCEYAWEQAPRGKGFVTIEIQEG